MWLLTDACPIVVAASTAAVLVGVVVFVACVAVVSATNQSNVVPAFRNGCSFVFHFLSLLSSTLYVSFFISFFVSVLFGSLVSLCCLFCFRFDFMLILDLLSFDICFAARSKRSICVFLPFVCELVNYATFK